jgi:ATP-dependent Lon protease
VAQLARKMARRLVEGGQAARGRKSKPGHTGLTIDDLGKLLGPPKFIPDERQRVDEVGIANGLAWTQVGGEVLHVEAQMMPGKGNLILTGQLGDVMKESAQAALSFARVQATRLGLRSDFLTDREIHIHVPAGGVPKDGPSAGITMACVLVSLVAGIPLRRDVAMTGEITLRGRVLPIGGLKEKLLAAVRAGMRVAIVPAANQAEVSELPAHLRQRIKIHPVHTVDEALVLALARMLPHPKGAEQGMGSRGTMSKVVAPPRRGGAA